MSEYAQPRWQDCRGDLHDTEQEAIEASRRHEIGKRMHSKFVWGDSVERDGARAGLEWFLANSANVIATYQSIGDAVDGMMDPLGEDTP